jgi:CheY-like chemotaxis protein
MTDVNDTARHIDAPRSEKIYQELPYLRRYARALTGSQPSGDAYVAALLEAILAEPSTMPEGVPLRVALYAAFQRLCRSAGEIGGGAGAESHDSSLAEATVHDRLSQLAPTARQALLLTVVEGFDTAEAAIILDMDEPLVAKMVEQALQELDRQTRARVLIIEDEPIIAMDLESIVRESGHDVIRIADTRDKAFAAAESEKPDLILADLQLADGSSGLDAVSDIARTTTPPVIFITAYPERLLTATRPEPTFLISKPFLPETVKTAVSQALFFREGALAT